MICICVICIFIYTCDNETVCIYTYIHVCERSTRSYIYICIFPKLSLGNGALTVLYYGFASFAGSALDAAEHLSLYKMHT